MLEDPPSLEDPAVPELRADQVPAVVAGTNYGGRSRHAEEQHQHLKFRRHYRNFGQSIGTWAAVKTARLLEVLLHQKAEDTGLQMLLHWARARRRTQQGQNTSCLPVATARFASPMVGYCCWVASVAEVVDWCSAHHGTLELEVEVVAQRNSSLHMMWAVKVGLGEQSGNAGKVGLLDSRPCVW